jgi:hypothetical protein
MGYNLSNPFLIDKYENYARLVALWMTHKSKTSGSDQSGGDTSALETATEGLSLSDSKETVKGKGYYSSALDAFSAECDRFVAVLQSVRDKLEQGENVGDFDRSELIKASPLKLVSATGQVCLASTQLLTGTSSRSSSAQTDQSNPNSVFQSSASLVCASNGSGSSSSESVADSGTKLGRRESRSQRKNKWGRISTIRKIM